MSLHVVPRSGTCLALNKSCWDRHHRSQDDYHQNQHNPHHHAILIIISVMTFTFFNKLLERSSYNSLPFLPLAPLHLPAISMIIVVGMRIIVMIILGGDKFTQKYCLWRKIPIWSTRSQGASLTSSWRAASGGLLLGRLWHLAACLGPSCDPRPCKGFSRIFYTYGQNWEIGQNYHYLLELAQMYLKEETLKAKWTGCQEY